MPRDTCALCGQSVVHYGLPIADTPHILAKFRGCGIEELSSSHLDRSCARNFSSLTDEQVIQFVNQRKASVATRFRLPPPSVPTSTKDTESSCTGVTSTGSKVGTRTMISEVVSPDRGPSDSKSRKMMETTGPSTRTRVHINFADTPQATPPALTVSAETPSISVDNDAQRGLPKRIGRPPGPLAAFYSGEKVEKETVLQEMQALREECPILFETHKEFLARPDFGTLINSFDFEALFVILQQKMPSTFRYAVLRTPQSLQRALANTHKTMETIIRRTLLLEIAIKNVGDDTQFTALKTLLASMRRLLMLALQARR